MPLIWLYVKKLNEPSFKITFRHLFHLLPFIIVMLISLLFLVHNKGQNKESMNNHALAGNVFVYVLALAQYAFYLIYILRLLRVFKSKVMEEFSNTENIDPAWLKIFLLTFLVVFVLSLFMMIIAIHSLTVNYFNNMVSLVFSFTIFIFGYKGLYQEAIASDSRDSIQISSTEESNSIENKVDEHLLSRLLDYMTTEKPFQDVELTLTSLAKQIDISRNQLSELINSGTGVNFYDFVNNYRVEEVKGLLKNPKYKDFTLLAIAYEAGFPSKSTFNSIFKKFTGLTPSEYRNRLL
jgi:AraC-like DNA-binding protein